MASILFYFLALLSTNQQLFSFQKPKRGRKSMFQHALISTGFASFLLKREQGGEGIKKATRHLPYTDRDLSSYT